MTSQPLALPMHRNHLLLWVVKAYLDLVQDQNPLEIGSGIKRLFVLSSGVDTLNDSEIDEITDKAISMKLLPANLRGFMNRSICKNLYLYSLELQRLLVQRVVDLAEGVEDNSPLYFPQISLLTRIKKATFDDTPLTDYDFGFVNPKVVSFSDVAQEAEIGLTQSEGSETHSVCSNTSWGYLIKVVEDLVEVILHASLYRDGAATDLVRSTHATRILLVLSRMILGAVAPKPVSTMVEQIDLDNKLNFTNGTLAAIPFPTQNTLGVFQDSDAKGISIKARIYLSAVSAALFYRHRDY